MNKTLKNNAIYLVPKSNSYSKSLYFMHGLGDCADSFLDVFDNKYFYDFKVVLLNAEKQPVTLNGGAVMPSWYDIKELNSKDSVTKEDVDKSSDRVLSYINEDIKNGDYSNVYLGGFSQGGFMSLYTGLGKGIKFGGLICLSGGLFPFTEISNDVLKTPIFMGHGKNDMMVSFKIAEYSYEQLIKSNFTNVKFKSYDMGHSLVEEELKDMIEFLSIKH